MTAPVRQQPDLVKVYRLCLRRIELAVLHARTSRDPLELPGPENRAVTEAVLVFQLAFQHVGDYFHVPVPVRPKPLARLHAVLVDYPEHAKAHVLGIVVVVKGKSVARIEPTVIPASALTCRSFLDHAHRSA